MSRPIDTPLSGRGLTIGAAAARVGATARALRLYEAQGLMPRSKRERSNRYRRYDEADLMRLRFIKRAQGLGFSLAEIGELLALDRGDCDVVQQLAERHLATVHERIHELVRLRDGLQQVIALCGRAGELDCPVLSALGDKDDGCDQLGLCK